MLAQWYETYRDQGLMIVTLLVEADSDMEATVEDLNTWVDEYGITHAVVTDPDWEVIDSYSEREHPALPALTLIAPGMEILETSGTVEEADVVAALP